ncbi:MAG: efflux RND transporter periplasmic adaptor subunit, partial [Planctomycetota bacterium]|nr:efflux RND transporter periplasmic adaptor subunit [Planctomycetota bacterium]
MSQTKARKSGLSRAALWIVVLAVVLGGVAWGVTSSFDRKTVSDIPLYKVRKGPLTISVTESGTIKNRDQVIVTCQVEGRTSIITLVKEGVQVKAGDLLVELDSSKIEEQIDNAKIKVINAESAFVRSRENFAIVVSQGESDVQKAALDLRFAREDFAKYQEGDFPQQLQQADAEIAISEETLERAKEKLEWSKTLHDQRYLSKTELDADALSLRKAEIDLELAKSQKTLLQKFTFERQKAQYESDIDQAIKALERVKRKAKANVVQAQAERDSKKRELARQELQLKKAEDQMSKCRIIAPVTGMVVYATTGGGWRGREEPIEEGKEVRKRQELIYLPTAEAMMANVKIHESSLQKVRPGLPVHITVEALPKELFKGTLARIAVMPDSQSVWLNPDLKLYGSDVHITSSVEGLRPGMSCKAEIFVDRYENALHIPVQCVVRVGGKPTVYVKSADGVTARSIEMGLDNNRMVHVIKGLEEGERVLMQPPLDAGGVKPERPIPDDIPKFER